MHRFRISHGKKQTDIQTNGGKTRPPRLCWLVIAIATITTVTCVVDDESLEVGRRDAGCNPYLHHVADGLVDVLDTSTAVTADGDWFHDVVVGGRRQSAVLHEPVLRACLAVGGRRHRRCSRRLAVALTGLRRTLDGEVVEREVDGLSRTPGDDPRMTAAVTVRRVGRHDAGDVARRERRYVQLVVRLAVVRRHRLHCDRRHQPVPVSISQVARRLPSVRPSVCPVFF